MSTTDIYGSVVDANTHVLLTSATVSCPDAAVSNGNGSYWATTPDDGRYRFTASCPGYNSDYVDLLCTGGAKNQNFGLYPS